MHLLIESVDENKLRSHMLVHPTHKIVLLVESNDKVQPLTEELKKCQDKFIIVKGASCMRTRQPYWQPSWIQKFIFNFELF